MPKKGPAEKPVENLTLELIDDVYGPKNFPDLEDIIKHGRLRRKKIDKAIKEAKKIINESFYPIVTFDHAKIEQGSKKIAELLSKPHTEIIECNFCGYEHYPPENNEGDIYPPSWCNNCGLRIDLQYMVKKFGDWAVTLFGIEHLHKPAKIYRGRISDKTIEWVKHMSEKRWINLNDFAKAYEYARKFFYPELYLTRYQKYLRTDHWKRKRQESFDYYGNSCVLCGEESNINVHHRNYDHLGKEDVRRDLIVLCRECHRKFHNK
ncbi:MAG: HNH endonuclease [Gammaproteobacteria bacterium]|uniref:Putative homing endonuclease n=1 Tax=viral metagenome TaxID=1070528 RepID=A0A6M3IWZ1_9ZZZZ|nr:HNH endonuclease [Gammaproteobacteria bacterium]